MNAIEDFDAWVEGLNLRHFKPHEVRFLGNAHYSNGKAAGLNKLPPKAMRARLVPVLRAADEARERLGTGVIILSSYRSPAYNTAIGGARASRHMQCDALDIAAPNIPVSKLRAMLKTLRKEGFFKGGLGLKYANFVHLDNRGNNVDF